MLGSVGRFFGRIYDTLITWVASEPAIVITTGVAGGLVWLCEQFNIVLTSPVQAGIVHFVVFLVGLAVRGHVTPVAKAGLTIHQVSVLPGSISGGPVPPDLKAQLDDGQVSWLEVAVVATLVLVVLIFVGVTA